MTNCRVSRILPMIVLASTLSLMVACQPLPQTPATAEATAVIEETVAFTPSAEVVSAAAPVTETIAPVSLAIPEIDLVVPVKPMGWEPADVGGTRSTRWIVPEDAAGWALNSAGAGAAGNTVIAGHQALGDAVFAAIALGDTQVGQTVVLTGEDGREFAYNIVEVSEPIALVGATEEEISRSSAYMAATDAPRLTLVTGWPAATTTHRLFVVAELAAGAQQ